MIKVVEGDLVNSKYDIFCHQVNCRGAMGSGIAKQIRDKYPEVYDRYRKAIDSFRSFGEKPLGHVVAVPTHDNRFCVNLFAQDGYGRDKQYTDYNAFNKCLEELAMELGTADPNYVVAFPYGIGCGLAGGDWHVISLLLKNFAASIKQEVVVVKWQKQN